MAVAEPTDDEATLFPKTVGERLRDVRVAEGLDLAEVAARTRIPQRHLQAIEDSNYSSLPSRTYATGFVRAYARAIGTDDVTLVRDLRAELGDSYHRDPPRPEPVISTPQRVPSRGIMMGGIVAAVIVLAIVALLFGSTLFRGREAPTATEASTESELGVLPTPAASPLTSQNVPPAAPASGGQVALIATDQVWVRIYDANNDTLLLKTLQPGERYDVPQGADHPMINIGRPGSLTVTLNGSQVAPLGPPERAIKDVEISAAALRARGQPDATSGIAPSAVPTVRASPAARSSPTPASAPRASATPRPTPRQTPIAAPTGAPAAAPTSAPAPAPTTAPTGTP